MQKGWMVALLMQYYVRNNKKNVFYSQNKGY